MQEPEIYAALKEIFLDLFTKFDAELRPDITAADVPGWDSLNHINLIVAVESRFGIRMKANEIESLTNVGDLVRIIRNKGV